MIWGAAVKARMRPATIVEVEVAPDRCARFGRGVVGPEIHLLVFDASPLPLDEYIVPPSALCRRGVGGLKIDDEINPVVFCVDGYTTVAFLTPNWYLETR